MGNTLYDVIVLGLGGIGSAVAENLSRAGHKVLGLEQFAPVHDRGSSHGESRVIRKAYFEDERYVPLLIRAFELWDELEQTTPLKLFYKTGCVLIGSAESQVIRGSVAAARAHALPHQILDSKTLLDKFGFHAPANAVGFFESDGGYLLVEECVEAFQNRARKNGAELLFDHKLLGWNILSGGEVEVRTDQGTFGGRKLVLCLGAWSARFLSPAPLTLSPKRVVQYWFDTDADADAVAGSRNALRNLPVYFQELSDGRWIYGFPQIGRTMKVAFHNVLGDCDPDHVERMVNVQEVRTIERPFKQLLPMAGEFVRAKTCMYTMTPDEHFALGPLRGMQKQVFLAAGFSGHGFKFAPVIGEIANDFVTGRVGQDISLFDPYRFVP